MLLLLLRGRLSFFFCYIYPQIKGPVAEWLGSGLQNHLQRFESARDLIFFSAQSPPPLKIHNLLSLVIMLFEIKGLAAVILSYLLVSCFLKLFHIPY